MAGKRKTRTLDRLLNPTSAENLDLVPSSTKVQCVRCGEEGSKTGGLFYQSKNRNYAFIKAVPICKSCLSQIYQASLVTYGNEQAALRIICMYTNSYYDEDLVDKLKSVGSQRISEYIKYMNLTKYAGLTFEDTLREEGLLDPRKPVVDDSDCEDDMDDDTSNIAVPQKVIGMFGEGYTPEEYKFLHEQYKDWVRRYDCNQKSLEEMIKSICLMQLNIRNASKTGADISKLVKSLNDTISAANLQPITEADEKDTYSYGQLIEKFEEDRPIEKDPAFEDVDNIFKYIGTFFFGGLTRVFGKRNEFSDLYDEEIKKYTVTKPHYEEDEDLSTDDIFGDGGDMI